MIKHLIHTAIAMSTGTILFAQGIQFIEEDWDKALTTAKQENKIIFLDAYTTWCGPCKMLAARVFPQADVGTFHNANFINAKVDMEKGQGIELAKKYNVRAYPTLLYINPDGEVVHTIVGAVGSKELIEGGRKALNPLLNDKGLKEQYLEDPTNDVLARKYIRTLIDNNDPLFDEVALTYLNRQSNWFEMNNEEIIASIIQSEDGTGRAYILNNWSTYQANKQHFSIDFQEDFVFTLGSMEIFFNPDKYKTDAQLNGLTSTLLNGVNSGKTYDALYAFYLGENERNEELIQHYKKMTKTYKEPKDFIAIAYNIADKGQDKKAWKLGLKIADKGLKTQPMDQQGRYAKVILLHKLGQEEKATQIWEVLQKELN